MNSLFKFSFLFMSAAYSTFASGQLDFRPGYIITLQNDTISGKINDGGGIRNSKVCLFKSGKDGEKTKYLPEEIKSYRFIGDKYYSSQEIFQKDEYKNVFTDVLLEGKMNLYYYRKNSNMCYFIQPRGGDFIGLVNQEVTINPKTDFGQLAYLEYVNGITLNIYKDTLYSLFRDSKKILKQVSTTEYSHKDLIKITKAYINETCEGNDCINYEKDLTITRDRFGVFAGMQFSRVTFLDTKIQSSIISSVPFGIFYNIPLPILKEGLSFEIEALTNSLSFNWETIDQFDGSTIHNSISSRSVGFPLLFKYEFFRGKVRPTVALGKEIGYILHSSVYIDNLNENDLDPAEKGGWFGELGLNYKLKPNLSLFTNLRIQSNHNLDWYRTDFATIFAGMKF